VIDAPHELDVLEDLRSKVRAIESRPIPRAPRLAEAVRQDVFEFVKASVIAALKIGDLALDDDQVGQMRALEAERIALYTAANRVERFNLLHRWSAEIAAAADNVEAFLDTEDGDADPAIEVFRDAFDEGLGARDRILSRQRIWLTTRIYRAPRATRRTPRARRRSPRTRRSRAATSRGSPDRPRSSDDDPEVASPLGGRP
jgi:hypothetical protein